jgi:hypothetical protein
MPDPTPNALSRQVANACQQLHQAPGLPFAQHLPARIIHNTLRQVGGFFRQRVYTPAVTLWTFLSQLLDADHSCRQAVCRLLAWRTAQGLPVCSPANSAYCKARARLPEALLARLTRDTGQQALDDAEGAWLWKGRRVKVVDGTGISMPDTPANQKAYPQPTSQKPGVGFPLLRLVVLFSLAVGTVLDAAFGQYQGKGTGESALFRTLHEQLQRGEVLLADRYYCSYWEVSAALARGADVVLRLHGSRREVNFRLGHQQRPGDKLLWWNKPPRPGWMSPEQYQQLPKVLRVRAVRVRVRQRGFRVRVLVVLTTILEPAAACREDIAELYRARWQAELNLRSLKQTLQMDVLRGQSPEMVRKELWGHLLVYNLVRGLMAQAARASGLEPRQVSFKGALQTFNAFWPLVKVARSEAEALRLWLVMIWAMGQHEVGNRPDRYEPRKVKRRPKNFDRLNEPRAAAKRRLTTRT